MTGGCLPDYKFVSRRRQQEKFLECDESEPSMPQPAVFSGILSATIERDGVRVGILTKSGKLRVAWAGRPRSGYFHHFNSRNRRATSTALSRLLKALMRK